jgi:hypothetical protein
MSLKDDFYLPLLSSFESDPFLPFMLDLFCLLLIFLIDPFSNVEIIII